MKAELAKVKSIAGAYKMQTKFKDPDDPEFSEPDIIERLEEEGEADLMQVLVDNEVLLKRLANVMEPQPSRGVGESSGSVPELTDSVIESLYKQAQQQRKAFGKRNNYVTAHKKIINPHVPDGKRAQPSTVVTRSESKPKGKKKLYSVKPTEADNLERERRETAKRNIVVSFADERKRSDSRQARSKERRARLEVKD